MRCLYTPCPGACYCEAMRTLVRQSNIPCTAPCFLYPARDGGKQKTKNRIDTVSEPVYTNNTDTVSIIAVTGKGDAMIKGTPELISGRREEIINACETLYQTMSFKEITLKEIGTLVPFSRPTIYNYFRTKEEIFLALFEREYTRWNEDLSSILEERGTLTGRELADRIAKTLAGRQQLLKLLSMNNYDMEENSRPERLTSFKTAYGRSLELMRRLLQKYRPQMNGEDIHTFLYVFFPFMFGIYPYTAVTEKQKTAMREAGVDYSYQTIYELAFGCLIRLLGED